MLCLRQTQTSASRNPRFNKPGSLEAVSQRPCRAASNSIAAPIICLVNLSSSVINPLLGHYPFFPQYPRDLRGFLPLGFASNHRRASRSIPSSSFSSSNKACSYFVIHSLGLLSSCRNTWLAFRLAPRTRTTPLSLSFSIPIGIAISIAILTQFALHRLPLSPFPHLCALCTSVRAPFFRIASPICNTTPTDLPSPHPSLCPCLGTVAQRSYARSFFARQSRREPLFRVHSDSRGCNGIRPRGRVFGGRPEMMVGSVSIHRKS